MEPLISPVRTLTFEKLPTYTTTQIQSIDSFLITIVLLNISSLSETIHMVIKSSQDSTQIASMIILFASYFWFYCFSLKCITTTFYFFTGISLPKLFQYHILDSFIYSLMYLKNGIKFLLLIIFLFNGVIFTTTSLFLVCKAILGIPLQGEKAEIVLIFIVAYHTIILPIFYLTVLLVRSTIFNFFKNTDKTINSSFSLQKFTNSFKEHPEQSYFMIFLFIGGIYLQYHTYIVAYKFLHTTIDTKTFLNNYFLIKNLF